MKAELKSLQEKTLTLIVLYRKTRQENSRLRKELTNAQSQNKKLNEKITTATERLEKLLLNIPDNES
ncbi:hypothetical protein W03_21630 [Nitrosomonas sp. PY1]|uniref:hypothetical protein n=1 Tax=Nitrosomonas sp. PY1 TaxID=1803906 RepID=UPI001FC7D267|nr:hypothetical protein [Nitrosomonas sp. PY1]GKS70159.1 hypothetical protein W03_21630 [Nitrosomonas sp. PY1]